MLKMTIPDDELDFMNEVSTRLQQISAVNAIIMASMSAEVPPSYNDINSTAWLLSDLSDGIEQMIKEYNGAKAMKEAYNDK